MNKNELFDVLPYATTTSKDSLADYFDNLRDVFDITCGIASTESIIGNYDDPRYLSNPEHYKANLLLFTDGWIKYPESKNDYKSDIHFSLNKKSLGRWTSPGNPSGRRGWYNPIWWIMGSEYGYKTEIIIDEAGTKIKGNKVSDVKITDINFLKKKIPY
jgi:predicted transcriptional regulator